MLKSLFGDLTQQRPSSDFAATAILETVTGETNDRGQIVDRHLRELLVTGSPAQAMRSHFGATGDDQAGTRLLALYDPARMWATSVIKTLSDASGQPIERLQLRDRASLGTLGMIERTTLPRRMDDTLKIYHADMSAANPQGADIPLALMERCDLACIIIGPLQGAALEQLLASLTAAAYAPTWYCPRLLFLLPVGATALTARIESASWPSQVQVHTMSDPLTSSSAVWNALLSHWNRVKPSPTPHGVPTAGITAAGTLTQLMNAAHHGAMATSSRLGGPTAALMPGASTSAPAPASTVHPWGGSGDFPIKVADIAAGGATAVLPHAAAPTKSPAAARPLDAARASLMVDELMRVEGLLFAAVVDGLSGEVVATEGNGIDPQPAAAAAADVLRVHRRTLQDMGHPRPQDHVDEILTTVGSRYHVIRTLQAFPDHFLFVALDKLRSNLAMARFRILESQQTLG